MFYKVYAVNFAAFNFGSLIKREKESAVFPVVEHHLFGGSECCLVELLCLVGIPHGAESCSLVTVEAFYSSKL